MKVRFSKNGFFHPAFGRMGRGKQAGDVYELDDEIFGADGALPKSAEIIDDMPADELDLLLEEQGQRRTHKPKPIDDVQLKKAKERAKASKTKTRARKPKEPAE